MCSQKECATKSRHSTKVSCIRVAKECESHSTLGFRLFMFHLFFQWLMKNSFRLLFTSLANKKFSSFEKVN